LCHDIQQIMKGVAGVYYGAGRSLLVALSPPPKTDPSLRVCDLSGADGSWLNVPTTGGQIAIDPHLGRIAVSPSLAGSQVTVKATYYYGFNGDMGGGEYARASTFVGTPEQAVVQVPQQDFLTLQSALDALSGDGVVEITDSGTHYANGLNVSVSAQGLIELRAAEGCRPTLIIDGAISVTGGPESAFYLNGLVVAYGLPPAGAAPTVTPPVPPALLHAPSSSTNQLSILELRHCTLVPGWALTSQGGPQPAYAGMPTLMAETSGLQVVIKKSIVGAMCVSNQATANLCDSIIDATCTCGVAYVAPLDATKPQPQPGGALTLQGCTVVGKVYAALLSLVSDSIFWASLSAKDAATWSGPVWASRKQQGCVRFSYLPAGSMTPRTFECVGQAAGAPQPYFVSMRYGDPGYLKLLACTDDAIRRGADDGGEMGAFHFLLAPLRETDLIVKMQEYLPVGLEFGVFYET
jgi:hypothetical protein